MDLRAGIRQRIKFSPTPLRPKPTAPLRLCLCWGFSVRGRCHLILIPTLVPRLAPGGSFLKRRHLKSHKMKWIFALFSVLSFGRLDWAFGTPSLHCFRDSCFRVAGSRSSRSTRISAKEQTHSLPCQMFFHLVDEKALASHISHMHMITSILIVSDSRHSR